MKRILSVLLLLIGWSVAAAAIIPAPRNLSHLPQISGAYCIYPDGKVQAYDKAGAYYAARSLEQQPQMPEYPLSDAPLYAWRGLHVDVSRHFFSPAVLRQMIDYMSQIKLNRLHLHLTDGPGWRIEIKRYPKLTSVGAWRKKLGPGQWEWKDFEIGSHFDALYGGYYTQDDLRQLVSYAAEHHIIIVPEIDVPGHAYAALVSYPSLSLLPEGTPIKACQVGKDVLNVNNEKVLTFVKNVLDELMALFPKGNPIHLGGDEVDSNILSIESQRLFMQNLVDYVKACGYQPITWDEAACNGVKGQWVMLWRPSVASQILSEGYPTILCPCSHFYFDYPQSQQDWPHPGGGHVITSEMVFNYTAPSHGAVLGMQANLWTEHISTPQQLFYMAFPRALALAERAWGSPPRPFSDFMRCSQAWMQRNHLIIYRLP